MSAMRHALLLLVATTAIASAGPKLTTLISIKNAEDNAPANAKVDKAFTAVRAKLDRCWRAAAAATVRVAIAGGKVKDVAIVSTDDHKASRCITKALRRAPVAKLPDGAVTIHVRGVSLAAVGSRILSPGHSTGDRSADEINRVIRHRAAVFRKCYQRELERDPSLRGKVVVRFAIEKDGKVQGARIASSTMGSKPVEQCIVAATAQLKFGAAAARSQVTYPFIFTKQ